MPLHIQYRSWCPHCVHGRGVSSPHRTDQEVEDLGVATLSMDYCFMTEEEKDEDICPTLIVYDDKAMSIWALPVENKGPVDYVVKWFVGKLEESGYGGEKVAIKSDQEVAILALKRAVIAARQGETVPIESPVRESKCNGAVERAVRTWQGQMRTIKHHVEHCLQERLAHDHPLTQWMMVWAADSLNRYKVHANGRTSYEIITGHRCNMQVFGIAEVVMWKMLLDKNKRHKMDSDWERGIYLGVNGRTTEHLVATRDGIFKCRTIRKVPKENMYDKESIEYIKVTVAEYIKNGAKATVPRVRYAEPLPVAPGDPADGNVQPREFIPRRAYLKPADFIQYGYTVGCQGCIWQQNKLGSRRGHTEGCRRRMEAAMEEDEIGRERIRVGRERVERRHREEGEENGGDLPQHHDEPAQDGQPEGPLQQEQDAGEHVDQNPEEEEPQNPEEEEQLEPNPARRTETGVRPPERTPAAKRKEEDPATSRAKKMKPPDPPFRKREGPHQELEAPGPEERRQRPRTQHENIENEDMPDAGGASSSSGAHGLDYIDRKIIAAAILGVDVSEIYSPERVAKVCKAFGLEPGSSMDLTNGWDFDLGEHRRRAVRQLREEKPTLLIGSPPCTQFSILQNLNKHNNRNNKEWMEKFRAAREKAVRHVRFCCSLYAMQMAENRYYLHEHPHTAESWGLDCITKLRADRRSLWVKAHMCRFGMKSQDKEQEGLVLKPTGFLTNSWCLAEELNKQCNKDHTHITLLNGKAAAAAVYPQGLCEAICLGLKKQKGYDATNQLCSMALSSSQLSSVVSGSGFKPAGRWPAHWLDNKHEADGGADRVGERPQNGQRELAEQINGLMRQEGLATAWDDVTQQILDADLILKARALEIDFLRKLGVYTKVPREHQRRTGGKIIGTRWVDTNKGDSINKDYRSRFVGKEFKTSPDDTLYASTPPLEALRLIVSWAATTGTERREVMINDVRRAYFYAKATRDIYIEIPEEDRKPGDENKLAKLNLCLYGTRDAALNWQETLSEHLIGIGFRRGKGHPSVFEHPVRGIKVLVHGDDYVSAGTPRDLGWLETELEKAYEIKTTRMGLSEGRAREGKVLNRIIRCNPGGWELEADPRHAELIIEQMGLRGAKGVTTPGTDTAEEDESEDNLEAEETTWFRGLVARANYLGMDRPDIQYAVKEACREMSKPTTGSMRRMKRIARYLCENPRLVWHFEFQAQPETVDIYTDANWAGCKRTRKSTSGGAAMWGSHCLKTWSKTQAVVAKSSAESELYAVVRGACEGLGINTLMADLGIETLTRIHMDATAAKGIIERKGLSKVRHIDTDVLWLQEQQLRRLQPLVKVKGTENPADMMTKNVPGPVLTEFVRVLNLEFREGRATSAAQLHSLKRRIRQERASAKLRARSAA